MPGRIYHQVRQERLIMERLQEAQRNPRLQITKGELARELEVSEKTIQRAIERLKYEHNLPVEWNARRRSYELVGDIENLPAIYMNPGELFVLFVSTIIIEQYRNTGIHDQLVEAVERLFSNFGNEKLTISFEVLQDALRVRPDPPRKIDPDIFETVMHALEKQRLLKIDYRPPGGNSLKRSIHPYRLIAYYGDWYIFAWCELRKAVRIFAVSRIENPVSDGTFQVDESLKEKIDENLKKSYGIFYGEKETAVRLLFSANQAPYIEEREWQRGQSLKEYKDGRLELSFVTNHLFEVQRWVLSFGAEVAVLAPKKLADAVREEHRRAADM